MDPPNQDVAIGSRVEPLNWFCPQDFWARLSMANIPPVRVRLRL